MSEFRQLQTPVAFIIFNRPEATALVFSEIRRARPERLFVIADGPRPGHSEDESRCREARAVTESIDWPCEVMRNYSESNLGCGERPATGISWVFDQVENAIILEDDCLPHSSFFRYCEELLIRYKQDERIMAICGSNFQYLKKRSPYSYYFSIFPQCTGWASWRRAWRYFDFGISLLPEILENNWLQTILMDKGAVRYWTERFKQVYGDDKEHIWDFQWTFACWVQGGVSIIPSVNLINNIGYGPDATHTKNTKDPLANLTSEEIRFPLLHPPFVLRDKVSDDADLKFVYNLNLRTRIFLLVKNVLSDFLSCLKLKCND